MKQVAYKQYKQKPVSALIKLATLVAALLLSADVLALKADREKPADIEADDTTIDFKTGKRTFIGNVLVVQGSLRIKADKVIANYEGGQLVNATAWGKLARFKSRPDGKPDDVEGAAEKIFVNQANNTLTLFKRATLKQGFNTAAGEEILYNMANDTLKIKGGRGSNQGKPKRKLEDPFKDDPLPASGASKNASQSSNKSPASSKPSKKNATTPTVETVPSGRSRLIIQPKSKNKEEDKN